MGERFPETSFEVNTAYQHLSSLEKVDLKEDD